MNQTTLNSTKRAAIEFLNEVEHQAKYYLPGGDLTNLEPESALLDTNAHGDNIVAESILGLADNFMRKCHNASGSYISAKAFFAWLKGTENKKVNALPRQLPMNDLTEKDH